LFIVLDLLFLLEQLQFIQDIPNPF